MRMLKKCRIEESNDIDVKAPRGTSKVKHDQNSGINFITVVHPKSVSIVSTATGMSPVPNAKRYNKDIKKKFQYPFRMRSKFITTSWVELISMINTDKLTPIDRSMKWT